MNNKKAKILDCVVELDEILNGSSPTDILCMGCHGDFSPHNNYFWFDVQGNLESADFAYNMPILFVDIVEYILVTGDTLENDEIKDLLNEIAEQEGNF